MATSLKNPFDQFDTQSNGNPFDQFDDTSKPQPSIFDEVLKSIGQMEKSKGEAIGQTAIGVAEQPAAMAQGAAAASLSGLHQIGVRPIEGIGALWSSAVKSGGDAIAGKSFFDRFSEDFSALSAKNIPDKLQYHHLSPTGEAISESMSSVLDTIGSAFGDTMHWASLQLGASPEFAAMSGAGSKAALEVLGPLAIGKGASSVKLPKPAEAVKVDTGKPVQDFVQNYPRVARQLEASQVGDAPIAAARSKQPDRHFMKAVDDAVNAELGITSAQAIANGLTVGDRINLVVQKHAANIGEVIPLAEQTKFSTALIDRIMEMQRVADLAEIQARPKALPAPIAQNPVALPTETLMGMRSFDRAAEPVAPGRLDAIKKDIAKSGIKEPITITISTKDNLALITDGNHRVTVAGDTGIAKVPVRYETTDMPFTDVQKINAMSVDKLGIDVAQIKTSINAADVFEKRSKPSTVADLEFTLDKPSMAKSQLGAFRMFTNGERNVKVERISLAPDYAARQIFGKDNVDTVVPTGKGTWRATSLDGKTTIIKELPTIAKSQRGIFDIEGLEKNVTAAKASVEKAANSGWAVNNPDTAARYVKEVMEGNAKALDKSRKAFADNAVSKARRAVYAHDYDLRTSLKNAGPAGELAHAKLVVQNGATMAAKVSLDKFNARVFDKLNHAQRQQLDEVTRLRRIIQIDKYKGIGSVRHEGGITGPMAFARLEQIKSELGDSFKIIDNSATAIFEEQKLLLDKLYASGLISKDLHGKLYNLDYTRTEYLDLVDPAIPIASKVRNMPTSIRSSGIPELGHGKLTAVNMDAKVLLAEDMARVENRIFKNNTLQAIRQMAIENPKNDIVKLPGKNDIRTLKNGDQAIRHTPEGYTTIGVRVEGKQEFLQMRDEFAEQFVNRPEAMPEWMAIAARTVSGTSLIKTTSTSMNPSFALASLPMDIFHTWIASSKVYSNHLPVYLTQMGRDLTATAKDAFTKSGEWENAMREGMGSSYLTHESRNLTDPSKSIKSQMTPKLAKTREVLSYLNDVTDVWVRLAYRRRVMQENPGINPEIATAMARDRLDYYQGGMVVKAIDTVVPYANVAVQATGKAIQTAVNDPSGAFTKAAWVVGTSAAFKLAAMVTSPETDKQISVSDKVRNFNITFGDQFYVLDANGNKRYMYVPVRLDQTIMPINAAVIGGLEKSEYGRVPEGLTGNAIGQISPVSKALPIPTIDAIATYTANYDSFLDAPVYRGPKVRPVDEIRSYGEGRPTSMTAQVVGQATGMSPMRLEAAAGKMINTNNFYIQAMGGGYKYMFQGSDPREQAQATMTMMQQIPGLRNIIKLTNPSTAAMQDLEKAQEAFGSAHAQQLRGLDDILFKYNKMQGGVTQKTIQDYINSQPNDVRQQLADHVKYTVAVDKIMSTFKASDGIPARTWWIASAKAAPEVRAQVFYEHWVSANPEDRTRMLKIANALQGNGVGYLSPEFQQAFAAERKLLGDERR